MLTSRELECPESDQRVSLTHYGYMSGVVLSIKAEGRPAIDFQVEDFESMTCDSSELLKEFAGVCSMSGSDYT